MSGHHDTSPLSDRLTRVRRALNMAYPEWLSTVELQRRASVASARDAIYDLRRGGYLVESRWRRLSDGRSVREYRMAVGVTLPPPGRPWNRMVLADGTPRYVRVPWQIEGIGVAWRLRSLGDAERPALWTPTLAGARAIADELTAEIRAGLPPETELGHLVVLARRALERWTRTEREHVCAPARVGCAEAV